MPRCSEGHEKEITVGVRVTWLTSFKISNMTWSVCLSHVFPTEGWVWEQMTASFFRKILICKNANECNPFNRLPRDDLEGKRTVGKRGDKMVKWPPWKHPRRCDWSKKNPRIQEFSKPRLPKKIRKFERVEKKPCWTSFYLTAFLLPNGKSLWVRLHWSREEEGWQRTKPGRNALPSHPKSRVTSFKEGWTVNLKTLKDFIEQQSLSL